MAAVAPGRAMSDEFELSAFDGQLALALAQEIGGYGVGHLNPGSSGWACREGCMHTCLQFRCSEMGTCASGLGVVCSVCY